jgi:aryl-alcohol dehydrogenase-like predicted oxidoreductase
MVRVMCARALSLTTARGSGWFPTGHHFPMMLPIAGTSSIAHFDESLEARELSLDEEDLAALEDAAAAAPS